MRLTLFIGTLRTGGSERQFATLAEGLAERGHEVQVLTLVPGGPLWDALVAGGRVPVAALDPSRRTGPLAGILRALGAAKRLRRELERHRSEVLYSALYLANWVAERAVRRTGGPRLAWGLRSSDMRLPLRRRLFFELGRRRSGRVPLLIANSRAGLAYHERAGFRGGRHLVIPNGIDTDRFQPAQDPGAALRSAWGVGDDEHLVGLVGRMDPMKDHPTFLRAGALLRADGRPVRLVCVGREPAAMKDPLVALAAELGLGDGVIWGGHRTDLPAVYGALDVLCLPSAYGEGFANVLGEALACGVPCVATPVGDAAEILGGELEGDGTRIVPIGSPEALAEAVGESLDRPADPTLGGRLRQRVVERYSLDAMVDATEEALCGLLAES